MANYRKTPPHTFLFFCLHVWFHSHGCYCLRSASVILSFSSSKNVQSARQKTRAACSTLLQAHQQPKTSKETPFKSNNKKRKKISKKEDVNALVTGMGLRTVSCNSKPNKTALPLDHTPQIDLETQLCYARNGHAVLRNFTPLSMANLTELRFQLQAYAEEKQLDAWRQKVQVACTSNGSENENTIQYSCDTIQDCQEVLRSLGVTASLPFLQYFNTWRRIPVVRDLAFALGQAASTLLDVPTVRLYQDALFWKRRNDGPTPWHVDARMAPFDTSHMITFWIPLHEVPREGTGLIFCSKSHADMALPYWNPVPNEDSRFVSEEWDRLEYRYPKRLVHYMPLQMGDATVHSGWTLHCSNGSDKGDERMAIAISFVDGDAEIRHNWESMGDNEDRWSYEAWCREVAPRTKFSHPLVPIVWPPPMHKM
jgi:ectoine hydroxylase-related dioxygenase (phytanoyl-CoA dioxygenase family)